MSKKKKIILISVLSSVAALLVATGIILWVVFRPVKTAPRPELDSQTVCYELPTDGSGPMDHTGIENIGYMNWRLQHQSVWYSEMSGNVDTVDKQTVKTYKQFYNGVMIATDIATSNLVNSAMQFCVTTEDGVVLLRYADCKPSAYNGINTKWQSGQPVGYTFPEYKAAMGLPPTDFSVFILNEKTVLECSDVTDNGNGTYTQSFTLNMASSPKENDAGYYYKQQMMFKGGLHAEPVFTQAVITYTFDSQWQVLSSETREVYKANKGFVANCTATGRTEYTYGDEELSCNPDYENYFKDYIGSYAPPKEKNLTAADCLAEAFGGVMQEETKLALDLALDGNDLSGTVQLNLKENDIRVDLGNIKVYMRTEDNSEQYLYITYGDNVKAKISLSDLVSDVLAAAEEEEVSLLDNMLSVLGDEEYFTIADDNRSATLTPTLDLGELLGIDLDITLNLEFKFNISEQKAVTLDYVKASGNVLGMELAAELCFTEKGVAALTQAEAASFTEIDVAGIASLAQTEALKIELSYNGYGVEAEGEITINLGDLQVKADLQITLDGDESAAKEISLIYANDVIYIALNTQGEQPAKVKANLSEASVIFSELFGTTEPDDVDALQTILDLIKNINAGNIINLLLSEDGLSSILSLEGTDRALITIDGTGLLGMFEVDFELGEVVVEIEDGGIIGLSALGLEATLSGAEAFTFDESEYEYATDLVSVVEKLINIVNEKKLSAKGMLSVDLDGTQVGIDIKLLSVDFSEGIKVYLNSELTALGKTEKFLVYYSDTAVKVSLGTLGVEIENLEDENNIDALVDAILALYNAITSDGESGEVQGIAAVLPEIGDMFTSLDGEEPDILALLNSLIIGGSDNSIKLSFEGFEITLVDESDEDLGLIGVSAAYQADGVSLSLTDAHLTAYRAPEYPDEDVEYFDAKYIIPLINKITDYVTESRLSVTGSIEFGVLTLTIDNLAINWSDGIDVKAQITLKIDNFQKTVYFEYGAEKIALYYDSIVVELAQSDVEGFIEAVQNLYKAIEKEVNADGGITPEAQDLEVLMSLISDESTSVDIFDVLSSIELAKNANGNLVITYSDLSVELIVAANGELSANVIYGEDATISATVKQYVEVELPENSAKLDVAELIPFIENVTEIITNKGITVSGRIMIDTGSTSIALTLYGLSVSWVNGIELQLDARLEANGSTHDFYAEYSAATGDLKIAYGALDSGAGIAINVKNDAETLEGALVALYNRIAAVVNNMIDGENVLPEVEDLSELLDLISTGKNTVSDVAELAETLEEIENEQPTIGDILSAIEIKSENGKLTVDIGGLTLTLWRTEEGFNISLQTSGVSIEIVEAQIIETEATDFNIEVEKALSAEDIADILDYIAATVELLAEDTFSITLEGTVTSKEEAYADVEDNVKYNIEAGFEYVQGESGYPVHIKTDAEEPDFWIAPDMYAHVYVNMISTIDEVDSVLFDVYILDLNPTIGASGKTAADFTSGDNELDIYLSISRIPTEGTDLTHDPLKIYAPMSEIMNILAAGVAIADLGSISTEIDVINDIISQISAVLDVLLVDRYLGNNKSQFSSLGSSLLNSLMGGSISDIVGDLLSGLMGSEQSDDEEAVALMAEVAEVEEGFGRERKGLINKLAVTREDGNSTIILKVGETETTVTKSAGRFTGLNINTSALNETETLKNLNIDISYDGIEKVSAEKLKDYTSLLGADSLVMALVNSATHKVPAEEQTEENSANYALNNNFFIDGQINLSALGLLNVIVNIEGLSVIIDENGEVQVNLSMSYEGVKAIVTLINGDTSINLSVKNGMVYIRRVQTSDFSGFLGAKKSISPITIYRAMPVDVFLEDVMEQMVFMFNFGDTIANAMRGGNSSSTAADEIKEDYGTQLGKYFKTLTFTESSDKDTAQWKAVINGTGLSELSGISLGDITATFDAVTNGAGGYVVNKLGIGGSLFSVLNFTATLNWQNPQEDWNSFTSANKEETAAGVLAKDPGADVRRALNNMTDQEIVEKLDWDRLAAESGAGYIELIFNDSGAMTSTVQFKDVTVKYSVKSGIGDNASEIYVSANSQYALVNTNTNSIYSVLNYPDISSYDIDGYSLVWLDPVYEGNDTYSVCARYVKTELKVTYYSSLMFNGSKVSKWTDGYDCQVYEQTVSFLSLSYGRPNTVYGADYNFVGWGYQKADGSWITVSDLRIIENLGYLDTIELHALWLKASIVNCSGSNSRTKGITRYYDMSATLEISIVGNSHLLSALNLSISADYSFTAGGDKTATANVKSDIVNGEALLIGSAAASGSSILPKETTWNASVSFNVLNNGTVINNKPFTLSTDTMNF